MGIQREIIESEIRTTGGKQTQDEIIKVNQAIKHLATEEKNLLFIKNKLESQGKKNTAEWKRNEAALRANRKATSEQKAELQKLNSQLRITEMTYNQLSKRAKELRSHLNNISKEADPTKWNKYNNELKAVQKQMTKVRTGTINASKAMNLLKTAIPIFSVTALIALGKQLVTGLFDLSKTMQGEANRANIVFGNSLDYVEKNGEKLGKRIGLTNEQFKGLAATTGDLLIPLRFTREEAANMSVEAVKLAGALDEWTAGKFGLADVTDRLNKALTGEMEGLKPLGIVIRQDSEEYKDLVKRKQETLKVTIDQARALATFELIQRKSTDAQTSFNSEANKLLRTQKEIQRWWRSIGETVVKWFEIDSVEKIRNEQIQLNILVGKLNDANIKEDDRRKVIEEIQRLYPDFLAGIDTEKVTAGELIRKLREVNVEYANKIVLMQQEEKVKKQQNKVAKESNEIEAKRAELEQKITEAALAFGIGEEVAMLSSYEEKINAVVSARQDLLDQGEWYPDMSENLYKLNEDIKNSEEALGEQENILTAVKERRDEILKLLDIDTGQGREEGSGGLSAKDIEAEKKRNEEILKQRASLYTKLEEIVKAYQVSQMNDLDQEITAIEDKYNKEIESFQQAADEKVITQKEASEAINQIWEAQTAEILAKQIEYNKRDLEESNKKNDAEIDEWLKNEEILQKLAEEYEKKRIAFLSQYRSLSGQELKELELQNLRELYDEIISSELTTNEIRLEITEAFEQAKAEIEDRYLHKKLEKIQAQTAQINAIFQTSADVVNSIRENELEKLENEYDKKIELAGDNTALINKLEEEKEKKAKQIKKKYADVDFHLKVLQINASTAQGIMSVWGNNTLPYPAAAIFNAIMSAVVAAQGIAQVAAAKTAKNKAKSLYTGGYTGEGDKYEPRGVVHANEYVVASEELESPQVRSFIGSVIEPMRMRRLGYSPYMSSVSLPKHGYADGGHTGSGSTNQIAIALQDLSWMQNTLARQNQLLDILLTEGVNSNFDENKIYEMRKRMAKQEKGEVLAKRGN